MKFRLKVGNHVENGKSYSAGDVVDSELDLVKAFGVEKFEPVGDVGKIIRETPPAPPAEETPSEEEPAEEEEPKEEPKEVEDDLGLDVTNAFETAKEIGVRVFKRGRWFNVIDKDGKQLNEKGLPRGAIEIFLEDIAE